MFGTKTATRFKKLDSPPGTYGILMDLVY